MQERLGRDPFSPPHDQWIEGLVQRDGEGWSARLLERDADGRVLGTREIQTVGSSCRELDGALTLALSLLIDPEAGLGATGSGIPAAMPSSSTAPVSASGAVPIGPDAPDAVSAEPASGAPLGAASSADGAAPSPPSANSPPDPAVHPTPPQGSLPLAPPTPRRGVEIGAMLAGIAASEWVPGLTPGVELATPIWIGARGGVQLGAMQLFEQRTRGAAASFGISLTTFSASGCLRSSPGFWRALGCIGMSVGSITGVVYDPIPNEPGPRPWVGGRGEAGGELRLSEGLSLRAMGIVAVPATRWAFQVDGEEPAFLQPPLLLAGQVALVFSSKRAVPPGHPSP